MARRGDANAARVRREHRAQQQTWSFSGGEAVSAAREGSLGARQERDERIRNYTPTSECRANARNSVPPAVKPLYLAADGLIGFDVDGAGVEDRSEGKKLCCFNELIALDVEMLKEIK